MKKKRRRSSLAAAGLAALLALTLTPAAGGCGQKQNQTVQGSDFTADRLPGIGSVYDYYTGAPLAADSEGIPVDFALEKSWNFSSGPVEAHQTASLLSPQGLPGTGIYPQANLCLKSELSGSTAYIYYLQDDFSRQLLGTYQVAADGSENWDRYDPPKTVLRFPMSADQEALEEICVYSNNTGLSEELTYMVNVRWIDTITVPAGTFPDAVMMQNYEVFGSGATAYRVLYYTWYAPDVGQVAYMHGPTNEIQPAFDRATEFRRLSTYQLP